MNCTRLEIEIIIIKIFCGCKDNCDGWDIWFWSRKAVDFCLFAYGRWRCGNVMLWLNTSHLLWAYYIKYFYFNISLPFRTLREAVATPTLRPALWIISGNGWVYLYLQVFVKAKVRIKSSPLCLLNTFVYLFLNRTHKGMWWLFKESELMSKGRWVRCILSPSAAED